MDCPPPKLEGSWESQGEAEETHLLLPTCPQWARPQQAEEMWSLCPKGHSSTLGPAPRPASPHSDFLSRYTHPAEDPFRTGSPHCLGPLRSSRLPAHSHPSRPAPSSARPRPSTGPRGGAVGQRAQPYLVVQSCRASGGQGLGHTLLQGQPVPRVGGRGGRLPGTRCILASWQVLLPRVNLRDRRGAVPGRWLLGKPAPREDAVPTPSGMATSLPRMAAPTMALGAAGTRVVQTLTSLE